jgi:hypothetical protein
VACPFNLFCLFPIYPKQQQTKKIFRAPKRLGKNMGLVPIIPKHYYALPQQIWGLLNSVWNFHK